MSDTSRLPTPRSVTRSLIAMAIVVAGCAPTAGEDASWLLPVSISGERLVYNTTFGPELDSPPPIVWEVQVANALGVELEAIESRSASTSDAVGYASSFLTVRGHNGNQLIDPAIAALIVAVESRVEADLGGRTVTIVTGRGTSSPIYFFAFGETVAVITARDRQQAAEGIAAIRPVQDRFARPAIHPPGS